jgi:hypothetical protein
MRAELEALELRALSEHELTHASWLMRGVTERPITSRRSSAEWVLIREDGHAYRRRH